MGRHDWFYSDAYRTAANIGLDYAWFQTDVGQTQAVSRLQYTLGVVNKENPYMTYEVDGTVLNQKALHPVGLLATTAEGSLAVLKDPVQQEMINSAEKELALWWVKSFGRHRFVRESVAIMITVFICLHFWRWLESIGYGERYENR